MISKRSALILSSLIIFLAAGCREPLKHFTFRSLDGNGWLPEDTLSFELDLRKTDEGKNIYISSSFREFERKQVMKEGLFSFFITMVSPSGTVQRDTLSLPFNSLQMKSKKEGKIVQLQWPYLLDVKPAEEGIWKIELTRPKGDSPVYERVRGVGISCKATP